MTLYTHIHTYTHNIHTDMRACACTQGAFGLSPGEEGELLPTVLCW